ncbi:beta-ketoacyl synthase N-terminal-like domain-containing protein [Paraburkholderia bonniea]|uniref:beta-ketoacyl synthase N-terminal-like domain-containing protein n=1 Tax=Paraburkholderia bonniea TaxID=2152891 RepID=UPI0012922A5F|nr:beta-ketoacyl synthase N-terminal-like domain-containing protein [Paraburkholderia bonniea]WJF91520.1 beta-ketoacyl synthase N-terminal-like domain-containing protein [Paraburkholderia bonniea]WJF94839.1 beta-ketoacyl synthase N-terminal-like domain-containing protein [Paraburkholderia bonniea]
MSYITGVGIVTRAFADTAALRGIDFSTQPALPAASAIGDYFTRQTTFRHAARVAREDRALLNDTSRLALDATAQAFDYASARVPYSAAERESCEIYTGIEGGDYRVPALQTHLRAHAGEVLASLAAMGEIRQHLNPLDMLRLLSTNTLYHLSKVFGLRGEGYPLRRMSLSGLCALEVAHAQLQSGSLQHALVAAVGDMTTPENLGAFHKMGLVRLASHPDGVLPAYGAAALMLERAPPAGRTPLAQVLTVLSRYVPDTLVRVSEWRNLLAHVAMHQRVPIQHVVLYRNGVAALEQAEREALHAFWPNCTVHAYKPYTGYTGQANNLIDLVLALADPAIETGATVLVNGVGIGTGLGAIVLRKLSGAIS